ncbi:reverse transcriptase domain-containing protein [Tanacetum coccineum]
MVLRGTIPILIFVGLTRSLLCLSTKNVPHDAIKFMLFPFSLKGAARIWLEKEPPGSIHTWEDLVSKFVNYFFPPSKTTNLKNDIKNFQQIFDETFSEAWDQFKDLRRKCPHYNFLELHQIDTFYNALTQSDQDSLNAAAGGKLLNGTPRDTLMIIENKLKRKSPLGSGSLPSNTIANSRGDLKAITTRSGVSYNGPTFPTTSSPLPKEMERELEATKDKVQNTNLGSTAHVQPSIVQVPIQEPDVAPKTNPKPSIPYPLRLNDQKLREKANNQMLKFLQIFQRLHFDISFVDALLYMHKFASMFKSLLSNKEKLFELANTLLNENCLAVLLKKLLEKLRDPDKFLIPCDFSELVECLALADLGTSINLIPLFVWKKLSLLELTPTRMALELANRSVSYPVGVAKDVIVKVGKFHFLADFVVVDYDVDPHVPLILGRPFLRTARALVDVYVEELILRDGDKQLIFHADNTSKHPHKHGNESINMINFIDITCEDRLKKFSSPTIDIDIVDPVSVLERFTDEPAFVYSSPPGDDNDDLFDLKSNNDEWRKLLDPLLNRS